MAQVSSQPELGAALADLRDIHLPAEPGWWPPAPGWWFLTAVCILAAIIVARYWRRARQRRVPRREALQQLAAIRDRWRAAPESNPVPPELSVLLRRVALSRFPRANVAALNGEQWLSFLDRTGETTEFSNGAGAMLASAPYRPDGAADVGPLLDLAHRWIDRVLSNK
ncbi:MAG: DUF4381 domain-containing protein [Gammaproteobacteria bacterium]|nr:DUF4381 domain-containing protein [Gammaproteobacteria bacterium]MDH3465946.1 DUF4381 domain-containing protein [Gammaproteobacteria bacterium]